jgi:hypothetical protein
MEASAPEPVPVDASTPTPTPVDPLDAGTTPAPEPPVMPTECLGECTPPEDLPLRPSLPERQCGGVLDGSWGEPMVISSGQDHVLDVQTVVHHDGALSVVWFEQLDDENSTLHVRRRTADGQWGDEHEVGATLDRYSGATSFQVAGNDWGDLVVDWYTGYEMMATVYDVMTDTWSAIAPLPLEFSTATRVVSTVDAYGTAIIVSGSPELLATRNTAADREWSQPVTLSPGYSRPTIAADHFGRVMVGWQDDITVAVIEHRAGVWYAPHQLSAAGPEPVPTRPLIRLAASDTGDFAALWAFGAEQLMGASYDATTATWSPPNPVAHPHDDIHFEQPVVGALRQDGKQLWVVESESPYTFATLQFTPVALLADAGVGSTGTWESEWISDLGGDYRDEVATVGPCLHGAMTRVDYGGIYDLTGTVTLGDGETLYWPPAESFEDFEGYTYYPHPVVDFLGRTTLVWIQSDTRQEETGLPRRIYVMDWR